MKTVFDALEIDQIEGPHAWIQWKGTDVCMDVHCACGAHMHFDGDFCYALKCPHCERVYVTGQNIRLHEVPVDQRPYHDPKVFEADEDLNA